MSQLALILSSLSIVFSIIGVYFMYLIQKVKRENDEICRAWRDTHSHEATKEEEA